MRKPIKPRAYPVGYQRVRLDVQLVFGKPDWELEARGPTDRSPEDMLLYLEAALESGELDEADVLTMLADRARRE